MQLLLTEPIVQLLETPEPFEIYVEVEGDPSTVRQTCEIFAVEPEATAPEAARTKFPVTDCPSVVGRTKEAVGTGILTLTVREIVALTFPVLSINLTVMVWMPFVHDVESRFHPAVRELQVE